MHLFALRIGLIPIIFLVAATLLAPPEGTAEDRVLTVASYGGAYTRSQMIAFVDPFRRATGQWVEMVGYGGGVDELRSQVHSLNVKWDVVDMTGADAVRACEEGLLERLEGIPLAPSANGKPASEDFVEGTLLPCAIGQNIWATVMTYDPSAYQNAPAPRSISDFFDLNRFPGSRALQKTARVNLEWSLLADGVSPDQVYSLLETDRGLERALAMLERIRPMIVWWTRGGEPLDLLQRRRVAMASAWSGRVFVRNRGRPGTIKAIWDGNVWEREYFVVPKGSHNREVAKALISFATDPERQAAQANQIAYSPVRRSAAELVAENVRPFLPTAPENAKAGLASDAEWWARHGERLEEAFRVWLDGTTKRRFNTEH